MKAALTAGLSVLLLAGAASPVLAETIIQQNVVTAPALIAAPAGVGAPVCTRELTFPATIPGGIIQVAPTPVRAFAFDYGCSNMDYGADFTWEAFGPYSDLNPLGGG